MQKAKGRTRVLLAQDLEVVLAKFQPWPFESLAAESSPSRKGHNRPRMAESHRQQHTETRVKLNKSKDFYLGRETRKSRRKSEEPEGRSIPPYCAEYCLFQCSIGLLPPSFPLSLSGGSLEPQMEESLLELKPVIKTSGVYPPRAEVCSPFYLLSS